MIHGYCKQSSGKRHFASVSGGYSCTVTVLTFVVLVV